MPTIDARTALTTMSEMHLIEQFAKWLKDKRRERLQLDKRPWRINLYTSSRPGFEEFTIQLGEPSEDAR